MNNNGTRTPYLLCARAGLGGLFVGVTGPLLSNFIPPMVRDVVGAVGMAVLPSSPALGLAGLLGAMVVLYARINLMRAPFQALIGRCP
jgi:hypothetical protein